ncbi:Pheromone-binding protein Gp-9 [Trachymyrmex septentrionalis]|uniref:Pheromone-binding protein Gp-9 n=1 Tax=Trachymyrmex septentrionalis TaxID=34720 RepID=A0A195F2Z8_9HYME|nr:Pheromone-binding protein Gp-9 [Trachymyrmex septentrionalis]
MKSLVLSVCILIIALSSSIELKNFKNIIETTEDDVEACRIENNVTHADVYSPRDMITDLPTKPENKEKTRRIGCWIACALKRQNLMEDSNIKEAQVHVRINVEYADHPEEVIAHKIARKCLKEVRNITEECEKSFSLVVCAVKTTREEEEHQLHEIEEAEMK